MKVWLVYVFFLGGEDRGVDRWETRNGETNGRSTEEIASCGTGDLRKMRIDQL